MKLIDYVFRAFLLVIGVIAVLYNDPTLIRFFIASIVAYFLFLFFKEPKGNMRVIYLIIGGAVALFYFIFY
ncbi:MULTISPECIES: hypothetical protein [Shouchella]|uniref:Uncharacterized protein n=3 Tax=Bacillaceae TaxID=186817 RepID=A0A060M034_9BACI|nr:MULTISPECIES: hypothetical protein [Bacillaceae]RQW22977.1 hypothetical protein EH196_03980 [Bacillus sp. C1-1]AIC93419.1 hypothetical protein BleG1_0811 [Shouchella lehensis G1]KQL58406.1 hypothetical protein AN965_03720 [Alkalicoccobacillus plakortidis]MBG9782844.1 hypothetical protein [Shouchella lehensis]TES49811.1 hypothetical protein E2L03_10190 [Shouchella lehensis]